MKEAVRHRTHKITRYYNTSVASILNILFRWPLQQWVKGAVRHRTSKSTRYYNTSVASILNSLFRWPLQQWLMGLLVTGHPKSQDTKIRW